jgi:hypothetical protein
MFAFIKQPHTDITNKVLSNRQSSYNPALSGLKIQALKIPNILFIALGKTNKFIPR